MLTITLEDPNESQETDLLLKFGKFVKIPVLKVTFWKCIACIVRLTLEMGFKQ